MSKYDRNFTYGSGYRHSPPVLIVTTLHAIPKNCRKCPYFTKGKEIRICWARLGFKPRTIKTAVIPNSVKTSKERWASCPLINLKGETAMQPLINRRKRIKAQYQKEYIEKVGKRK